MHRRTRPWLGGDEQGNTAYAHLQVTKIPLPGYWRRMARIRGECGVRHQTPMICP